MMSTMRYVTRDEYEALIPGGTATDEDISQAEYDIDGLTFNRITASGIDGITEFQRGRVKRAVCYQADFRHEYTDALNSPLSSYGINGVSMSWDKSVLVKKGSVYTTNGVYSMLQQTGLMYRGVMV